MQLKEIELGITGICNLRCLHCSAAMYNCPGNRNDLSLSEIRSLITQAKALGARKIDLTGGEPTLRPDLCHIIGMAKEAGLKTKLLSNGTLLNEKKIRELKASGLDGLAISLDGSSNAIQAKTRRTTETEFQNAITVIEIAARLGIAVKVNTAVSAMNLADLPNISRLAAGLGCYEHRICLFLPVGRGQDWSANVIEPHAWVQFIKEGFGCPNQGLKTYVAATALPEILTSRYRLGCLLNNPLMLGIAPGGDVFPCAIFAFNNLPIGNIRKTSLAEMWSNKKIWQEAKQLAKQMCQTGKHKDELICICPCRKIDLSIFGNINKACI